MTHSATYKKISVGLISILIALPILVVLGQVINISAESWYHLSQNLIGTYTKNTLIVVFGVSFLTLTLGVPTAWWISTNDFPFRKHLDWLLILPLAIPTFINGIAYSGLTDYTGPIRVFWRSIGFSDLPLDILNVWGVIFVMSLVLFPYVYLSSRAVFALQSASQLEASRLLGASPFKTFWKVGLPLAWPGIFAGLMLVIMEVLNDYGTVHYFGVSTFTTGIFKSWLSLGDMSSAVLLAIILMLFVVSLLWIENRINRNKRFEQVRNPVTRFKPTGKGKWWVMIACLVPFVLGFLVPVMQMAFWLFLSWDRTNNERLIKGLGGTLEVSILTSVVLVVLAWLYNFLKRGGRLNYLWKSVSNLVLLGYSMPGAVVGIGVLSLVLVINPNWIFGATFALIIGYVTRFFAVAQNPIAAGYSKVPMSIDESAQLLGKTGFSLLSKIHFPILRPALLAGFILVLIDVTKELPLTLILRPFNFETLSSLAFQYATDEMAAQSAAPSLMIILISALPVYFLHRIFGDQ